MLKEYPKFKRGEIERFYEELSKNEQKLILDYLDYRKARGITTAEALGDIKRYILHVRFILEKDLMKITNEDLIKLFAMVGGSYLSKNAKSKIQVDMKNFLKHYFKDWSMRFNDLENIKIGSNGRNEEKINASSIIGKDKVEKLVNAENSNYWKSFLTLQYEGGLRTIETRLIKWKDIKLNYEGDLSEVNIYATKTHKQRTIYVKEATFWLNKLKEEQEREKTKGVYVFHAKKNINDPIDKHSVSMWFRRLTERVLGTKGWCYLLRHGRASELYKLAKENKISKDTAIKFMGHSEDMSDTYTHLDAEDVKKMLRDQVFKVNDVPEDRREEFIKVIDERIEKALSSMQERIAQKVILKVMKKLGK